MAKQQNKKIKPVGNLPLFLSIAICAVAVVAMIIALCVPKEERGEFTPPPFEANAVSGVPTVNDALGYSEIYQDGMGFSAWVCGNVTMNGKDARVYFTNPAANTVWLKVRLLDASGNILGESGILKPGEYVEHVTLTSELAMGMGISIKIMAYEPETYHSEGAVVLNTAIGNY